MRILLTFTLACLLHTVSAQDLNTPLLASTAKDIAEYVPGTNKTTDPKEELDSTKTEVLKAVIDNPTYVPNIDKLAALYRDMGKVDSAIHYYELSLQLKEDGIIARQSLAAAYLIKENYDGAIKQYKKMQEKHPDYPEAYHGLARVYLAQKEYEKALLNSEVAMMWYLAGKKNLHAADARMLGGQAYMYNGEHKKAIKYFKACKKQLEEKAYYHYYIGFCYLEMGKKKEAQKYLSKAEEMGYQILVNVKEKLAE